MFLKLLCSVSFLLPVCHKSNFTVTSHHEGVPQHSFTPLLPNGGGSRPGTPCSTASGELSANVKVRVPIYILFLLPFLLRLVLG